MRSGIILAGGESSRMGIEKGTALLNAKPLVVWVYEQLRNVVQEIVLSVARERTNVYSKLFSDVRIAKDERTGLGPIGGLYTGLKHARGEYVAVAPCDTPFIQPELYSLMFATVRGFDGVVPRVNNKYEPLIAVYRRNAMLVAIERALATGRTKPIDAYPYLKLRFLDRNEISKVDSDFRSFININTVEDLKLYQSQF